MNIINIVLNLAIIACDITIIALILRRWKK